MNTSILKYVSIVLVALLLNSCAGSSSDDGEDLFKEVLDIAGYTFPGHTNGDGYCNMGDTFGGKASFIFGKDNSLAVSYGVYMSLESKILEQLDKKSWRIINFQKLQKRWLSILQVKVVG